MGVVYKAIDKNLDRIVALKFLASHLVSNDESRRRFIREAKAAAALQHPNICTVYEIDEVNGQTFIAMAYLDGQELSGEIESGPIIVERLLDLAEQVARGLQEAHSKGVVHRDIKPANIMVTAQGQAVLMDFGLAQLAHGASKLTKEGTSVGTSAYMSPEQTSGEKIDLRTDVWALGVVLYEMATGQAPFQGHYEQAILYSILNEPPEPITAVRTGVPPELERIVNKCLAKRAGERYQTVSDLLADLSTLKRVAKSGAGRGPSSGSKDTRPRSRCCRSRTAAAAMRTNTSATASVRTSRAPWGRWSGCRWRLAGWPTSSKGNARYLAKSEPRLTWSCARRQGEALRQPRADQRGIDRDRRGVPSLLGALRPSDGGCL